MGRQRTEGVQLPEGVQVVRKRNGKTYFYWAPRRGTKGAGQRLALGCDPKHPDFWAALKKLTGELYQEGTFAALIADYQGSADWGQLRPATRKDYAFHLERIKVLAGDRSVAALTKRDLYLWRDTMAETPATANHALSIMGTLLEFSVARGFRLDNPAIGVKKLSYEADGAHPWPDAAWEHVKHHAPEVFKRLAILGRATGQRRRDLVKLRPADRHLDGFQMRISKLGDKPHFVPLTQAEIREIDAWDVGKLDLYLKNPQNKPYTAEAIGHRWDSWRRPIPVLKDVTIHGLRATAVCDRRMRGIPHHAISAELCMSLRQVMHYSRFIDQPTLARSSRDQREMGEVTLLWQNTSKP